MTFISVNGKLLKTWHVLFLASIINPGKSGSSNKTGNKTGQDAEFYPTCMETDLHGSITIRKNIFSNKIILLILLKRFHHDEKDFVARH